MTGRLRAAAAVLAGLVFLGSAAAAEPARPIGEWERTAKGCSAWLTVEEGRLHLSIPGGNWMIHADYSITRDGMVYGIVTSADGFCSGEGLIDQTFSCRYRIDEGRLIVRDLKFGNDKRTNEELIDLTGPWVRRDQKPAGPGEESEPPPAAGLTGPGSGRKGKLLLLSFWASDNPLSQKDIPDLIELQRLYESSGLEVLGIAREEGGPLERFRKIHEVRHRYGINYPTPPAADAEGRCLVNELFDVTRLPTLILLDGKGRTLWRGSRLGVRNLWELESEIKRGLGIYR